jgi:hypothetical protein
MSESVPKRESAPTESGFDAFENLIKQGKWDVATEVKLNSLLEEYEEEFYTLFLTYEESGLIDTLPNHERKMYEWLAEQFSE